MKQPKGEVLFPGSRHTKSPTFVAATNVRRTGREDFIRIKVFVNTVAVRAVGERHVCGVIGVGLGNSNVVGIGEL